MQPISVDDVAASFLKALDDPAAIGQTYELAGPEVMTVEEIYDLLAQAMQIHKPKIHAPFWLLRPTAAVMQAILPNPPITVDQAIMLEEDNVCDITPMRESLGIEPRDIQKETLARAREA
jgi:nucleoside-diphosphate-sugar epimerase